MNNNIPFHAEKISWFKEKLGMEKRELEQIENFGHLFIEKKTYFSGFFVDSTEKIS